MNYRLKELAPLQRNGAKCGKNALTQGILTIPPPLL